MALNSTVAGPDAVSYASVQEADAYFNSHWSAALTSAWKALRGPQKETLLASATRILETLPVLDTDQVAEPAMPLTPYEARLAGMSRPLITKSTLEQALQLPRNIDIDEDGVAFIRLEAKEALYMQAVYMIKFDDAALAAQLQGISYELFEAGGVRGETTYGAMGSMLSPHAFTLMRPLIRKSQSRRMHRA